MNIARISLVVLIHLAASTHAQDKPNIVFVIYGQLWLRRAGRLWWWVLRAAVRRR